MAEGGVDDWWIHGSITFGQGQKKTIKNERLRLWRHCANWRGSRSSDDLVSCFCPQVTRGAVSPEVRGVSTQDRITPRGLPENLPAGAYWTSEIENGQAHSRNRRSRLQMKNELGCSRRYTFCIVLTAQVNLKLMQPYFYIRP